MVRIMGWMSSFFEKDKEEDKLESADNNETPDFHYNPFGSTGTEIFSGYYDED